MTDHRALLRRILAAWDLVPQLRLGQLISNACEMGKLPSDLYYVEDEAMARAVEWYAREKR